MKRVPDHMKPMRYWELQYLIATTPVDEQGPLLDEQNAILAGLR